METSEDDGQETSKEAMDTSDDSSQKTRRPFRAAQFEKY